MQSRWPKRLQTVAAALGWWAVALQFYLAMRLYQSQGMSMPGALMTFFSYFTILTNILVALALTIPVLFGRSRAAEFFARPTVNTAIAASIALVGIAYTLLLQHLWNPQGSQLVADELLHHVMPGLFVIYWWFMVPRGDVRWSHVLRWLLYPGVYFLYIMLRGALTGAYPYPFIDVSALGYARAVGNAAAVLIGFVVLASLLIAIGRLKRENLG